MGDQFMTIMLNGRDLTVTQADGTWPAGLEPTAERLTRGGLTPAA